MITKDLMKSLEPKKDWPEFRVGDMVRIHVRIREGEKDRIQMFEGTVIKKRRAGGSSSFIVRKVSYSVGVERIFPFNSPSIDKIEVLQRGKVRRSKLYYLRGLKGRAAVIDEQVDQPKTSPVKSSAPMESEGHLKAAAEA